MCPSRLTPHPGRATPPKGCGRQRARELNDAALWPPVRRAPARAAAAVAAAPALTAAGLGTAALARAGSAGLRAVAGPAGRRRATAGSAVTACSATAGAARTTLAGPAAAAAARATATRRAGPLVVGGDTEPAGDDGALARGELDEDRVPGAVDHGRARRDARGPAERADVAHLVGGHQGDDRAGGTGSRRTPRPVQVGLVLGRRVGVDHEGDVVDVDAARGDVGGHHRGRAARVEGREVAGARALAEVAVHLDRGYAALVELAGEHLGPALGAREDHRPAGSTGQVDQHGHALGAVDVQDVVLHDRDRRLHRVGLVGDRAGEEPLHQRVDRRVEGRGEEQPLTVGGRGGEDAAHGRQEAEVGHVVGLVEHGDLDVAERAVSLAHQVLEPAGAGEHDVDATLEAAHLRALADAAVDDQGREARSLGQRLQRGLDLADELTGRSEDERARGALARRTTRGLEAGDQREQEGVGLAGARAAAAEHVAAGQRVGQRDLLDGSGGRDAARGEHVGERWRGRRGRRRTGVRRQGRTSIRVGVSPTQWCSAAQKWAASRRNGASREIPGQDWTGTVVPPYRSGPTTGESARAVPGQRAKRSVPSSSGAARRIVRTS